MVGVGFAAAVNKYLFKKIVNIKKWLQKWHKMYEIWNINYNFRVNDLQLKDKLSNKLYTSNDHDDATE